MCFPVKDIHRELQKPVRNLIYKDIVCTEILENELSPVAVGKLKLFSTNPTELPEQMQTEHNLLRFFLDAGYLVKLSRIAGPKTKGHRYKYRRADPFSIATAFGDAKDELKEVQKHEGYTLESMLGDYFLRCGGELLTDGYWSDNNRTEIDLIAQIGGKVFFGSSKRNSDQLSFDNLLAHMICFASETNKSTREFRLNLYEAKSITLVLFSSLKKENTKSLLEDCRRVVGYLQQLNSNSKSDQIKKFCNEKLGKNFLKSHVTAQFPFKGNFELEFWGMKDIANDVFIRQEV